MISLCLFSIQNGKSVTENSPMYRSAHMQFQYSLFVVSEPLVLQLTIQLGYSSLQLSQIQDVKRPPVSPFVKLDSYKMVSGAPLLRLCRRSILNQTHGKRHFQNSSEEQKWKLRYATKISSNRYGWLKTLLKGSIRINLNIQVQVVEAKQSIGFSLISPAPFCCPSGSNIRKTIRCKDRLRLLLYKTHTFLDSVTLAYLSSLV